MSQADLMIGAGGTMTREAALMGVPTVSLFAGRRPAVDRWLEERGFMRMVTDVRELPALECKPRPDRMALLRERGERLVEHFCDAVAAGARGAG
jgi:predicted glycosyltransferase